jgi:hypothetical protein
MTLGSRTSWSSGRPAGGVVGLGADVVAPADVDDGWTRSAIQATLDRVTNLDELLA